MHCRHKLRRTRLLGRGSSSFWWYSSFHISFHFFSQILQGQRNNKKKTKISVLQMQAAVLAFPIRKLKVAFPSTMLDYLLCIFPLFGFFSVWIWCLNLWFCAARSKIQSWGAFDLSGERRGGKSGSVNVQKIALAASSTLSCHRKNRGEVLSMSNLFIWTTPILGLLCHQNGLKEIFFFMWRC